MSIRRVAVAGVLFAALAVPSIVFAQARIKVLLDTDIGTDIDDAWALGLLMASPEVELVGVTHHRRRHGRAREGGRASSCTSTGRDDVPVAVGRAHGAPNSVDYQFTWAEEFTAKQPVAQPAADFIVDTLRAHPGEITLIAVGPLQNVADAIRKEPKLGTLAKRIVLMSGSIGGNAWSPWPVPEWNVVRSTADAQLVYSTLSMTTVPLDSTSYVTLKTEERARLEAAQHAAHACARGALPAVVERPDHAHDAARPDGRRRDAAAGRVLQPLRVDADPRGRQGFTRVDASGRQAADGVPGAEARRVHGVLLDGLCMAVAK